MNTMTQGHVIVLCNLKTSYDVHRFTAMHSYFELLLNVDGGLSCSMWCPSWGIGATHFRWYVESSMPLTGIDL